MTFSWPPRLFLPHTGPSSLRSPGLSSPGLLSSSADVPVFQSWVSAPRMFQSRGPCCIVAVSCPGWSSPGLPALASWLLQSWAEVPALFLFLDAPVQGAPLLCGFFLAPDVLVCGTWSTLPVDAVLGLCTTLPSMFQSRASYYPSLSTLASCGGVCAPPPFLRAPFAAPLPPLLPAPLCVRSCSPHLHSLSFSLPSTLPFPSLCRSPLLPSLGSLFLSLRWLCWGTRSSS